MGRRPCSDWLKLEPIPDTIRCLVENGYTIKEIAKEIGCSWNTALKMVDILGLHRNFVPKYYKNNEDIVRTVQKLLNEGKTQQKIADIIGCNQCTVYRIINKHNILPK